MSKNISVEAHVKRYLTTDLADVVKLIDGLTTLVDTRREETILEKEKELALLKSGGIPEATKPERAAKTTRGSKKNKTEQEAEG